MSETQDEFWRALRQQLDAEQATDAAELEAIERELAETEELPLDEERIEEMVRFATEESEGARVIPLSGWRRFLAAAAALLIAPQFVVAASAATVAAVAAYALWPSGENSTERLPYQDAVTILLDARSPDEARLSAASVLAGGLIGGASDLRRIEASGSAPLRATATNAIDSVAQRLWTSDGLASPRWFQETLDSVRRQARDESLSDAQRLLAIAALVDRMHYGVDAITEALRHASTAQVEENLRRYVDNIAAALGR